MLKSQDGQYFGVMAIALSFAAMLACSALIPVANAQTLYGSIVGNVTDSSGAAVVGANVKVTQIETSESREVKTNDSGGYTLTTVPAGTYTVAITQAGFRTSNSTN